MLVTLLPCLAAYVTYKLKSRMILRVIDELLVYFNLIKITPTKLFCVCCFYGLSIVPLLLSHSLIVYCLVKCSRILISLNNYYTIFLSTVIFINCS